jgi:hypothetical protein
MKCACPPYRERFPDGQAPAASVRVKSDQRASRDALPREIKVWGRTWNLSSVAVHAHKPRLREVIDTDIQCVPLSTSLSPRDGVTAAHLKGEAGIPHPSSVVQTAASPGHAAFAVAIGLPYHQPSLVSPHH